MAQVVDPVPVLPPARGIPVTFLESFRSWCVKLDMFALGDRTDARNQVGCRREGECVQRGAIIEVCSAAY
jgi:hypothetical protein